MTTHHDREVRALTAVIALVCGVAFLGAVIPAVEHATTGALITGAALAALTVTVRLALRWLRERREDRADDITAAAWRATHPVVTVRGVA